TKQSRIIVSERDEVDTHATKLVEQIGRSYAQASGTSDEATSAPIISAEEWEELSAEDDPDMMSERAEIKIRRRTAAPRPAVADVPPPAELFADWNDIAARLDSGTEVARIGLAQDLHEIRCQPTVELRGRLPDWVAEIKQHHAAGETTLFVAATPGRAERTIELLKEDDVFAIPVERAEDAQYAAVLVAVGGLSRGFRLPDAGLQIYAEADVFEEERRAPERRRSATKAFLSDLRDLKVGDLIVHVDHGIGVFIGLKQIGIGDNIQEFLELRYAGDDKLFVPVERLDLVQKYTGATKPPVDKL